MLPTLILIFSIFCSIFTFFKYISVIVEFVITKKDKSFPIIPTIVTSFLWGYFYFLIH
jgi:hypothetical protein